MPEQESKPRAEYVPPILERHPDLIMVIGCSVPGGLGCLPFDGLPNPNDSRN